MSLLLLSPFPIFFDHPGKLKYYYKKRNMKDIVRHRFPLLSLNATKRCECNGTRDESLLQFHGDDSERIVLCILCPELHRMAFVVLEARERMQELYSIPGVQNIGKLLMSGGLACSQ